MTQLVQWIMVAFAYKIARTAIRYTKVQFSSRVTVNIMVSCIVVLIAYVVGSSKQKVRLTPVPRRELRNSLGVFVLAILTTTVVMMLITKLGYVVRVDNKTKGLPVKQYVILAVIMAPFVEEYVFRYKLLDLGKELTGNSWVAIVTQAVVFGSLHSESVYHMIVTFFVGIALGYIMEKYENIWLVIVLHLINNLIVILTPTSIVIMTLVILLLLLCKKEHA